MAKINKVIDNSYGYYMYANGTSHWGIGVYKGDECPILISKELHNAPENVKAPVKGKDVKDEDWNKTVEDIAGSTLKLTTIVDDKTKESLEYEVTDTNRKAATEIMKQLGSDPLALFSQFKSADGKYDNKSIYDAVLRFITSNDAVKIAYQNAKAKGAEAEVKGLKNVDFKTDGTSTPTKKGGLAEALKQSIYGK